MATRKKSSKKFSKKSSRKSCRCPEGSERISTKGRGRGFVCRSKTPYSGRSAFRPFVKAVGCK